MMLHLFLMMIRTYARIIDYEQNENNESFIELENSNYEMFDLGASSNFTPNILDTNENYDINNFSLDDFDFSF